MATPAEHKTEAERLLTRYNPDPPTLAPGYAARVHAHAALSQALGTGTHYDAADALLAALSDATPATVAAVKAEQAMAHALPADRA